jgi:uncharacterized protein
MSRPIVFFELAGPDSAALESFYGALFGWTAESRPFPGYAYTKAGALRAGYRQEVGVPPERLLYVGVPDVQATLNEAVAAGATIAIPVMTLPGVGTFAAFTDPSGLRMGLFEHRE